MAATVTGAADSVAGFFSALFVLIVFAGVVVLAYYSTKWIARARAGASGANVRVLESAAVAPGANVALVRAGGEYFLVGAGKDGVSLIAKLPADSVKDDPVSPGRETFERYLSEFRGRFLGKRGGNGDAP